MSEPRPAIGPEPIGDSDKLPWLEPYRERIARAAPAAKPVAGRTAQPKRSGAGTALLGVVGALALGAGGYWFGRETAPREVITPQTTVIAPLPPSPIPVQRDGPLPYRSLDEQPADPVTTADPMATAAPVEPPQAAERTETRTRAAPRAAPVARTMRETPPPPPPAPPPPRPLALQPTPIATNVATPVAAPISVAVPPSAPPAVVHRNAVPSVGTSGEVIELGAFISRRTADAAYRRVVRRYPYLGTRPKTVTAFPRSADWPKTYRLRLGTGSARNAKMLCRYVRSIGQRCAVV